MLSSSVSGMATSAWLLGAKAGVVLPPAAGPGGCERDAGGKGCEPDEAGEDELAFVPLSLTDAVLACCFGFDFGEVGAASGLVAVVSLSRLSGDRALRSPPCPDPAPGGGGGGASVACP